jgi:probable phosphoglycerate mutase
MVSLMPTRLVILRHGETEWSLSGQHTGLTDLPLTAAGRTQAASVASRLAALEFRSTSTSPLQRATETATLAGFDRARRDPDVIEWDYGAYEALTTAEIRVRRPGWEIFRDGVPGGETIQQVAERADRVITRVRQDDGDALVISHGHFSRILAARWLGLPPEQGRTFAMSPAALSMLGYKREVPVILRWNDACHIEDDWCAHSVFPDD